MFITITIILTALTLFVSIKYRSFSKNFNFFLANNNKTQVYELGLATAAHWMFAIAIFFGTGIAYKFGYIGLFYFTVPNVLSLIWMGYIATGIRKKDKRSKSLVEFIQRNCSKRVSIFFKIELVILALSALTLTFLAISKIYDFSGLNLEIGIESKWIVLGVVVLTLIQALSGGLKTSLVTGSLQGVLWLIFSIILLMMLSTNVETNFSKFTGATNVDNLFDKNLMINFAIFTTISLTVGATSHGSLWQKSYSSQNLDLRKSYLIAAIVFGIILFSLSFASLSYVSVDDGLKNQQQAIVKVVGLVGGEFLLTFFSILVILHSSSLIDAYTNYASFFVSRENNSKSKNLTKLKIITASMVIGSYIIYLSGVTIWFIFGIMSIARIINFFILIDITFSKKINEKVIFNTTALMFLICFSLFVYGKINKESIYVMYSGILGFFIPYLALKIFKK